MSRLGNSVNFISFDFSCISTVLCSPLTLNSSIFTVIALKLHLYLSLWQYTYDISRTFLCLTKIYHYSCNFCLSFSESKYSTYMMTYVFEMMFSGIVSFLGPITLILWTHRKIIFQSRTVSLARKPNRMWNALCVVITD